MPSRTTSLRCRPTCTRPRWNLAARRPRPIFALQHAPPAPNQARGGRQPQPASRIGRCVLAGRLASPALVPTQALVARSRHRAHHDLLLHEHRCKAAAPGRQLARSLEAGRSCKARRRGGRGLRRHQAARDVVCALTHTQRCPVSAVRWFECPVPRAPALSVTVWRAVYFK